jgi:predicted ATPase/DNA-binding SARP family transcriptional activator
MVSRPLPFPSDRCYRRCGLTVAGPAEQLDVRILGPLEVVSGGSLVPLGGHKQRTVLAILATRAGAVVSADELIESLWGECPPATATTTVQVYVSRLRKLIGVDRIATTGGGYALSVLPDQLDAARFDQLAARGRELRRAGAPIEASTALTNALSLWRGPALTDFAYDSWAQADIARLEEQRLACLEERIEADLACARDSDLVGELEELRSKHPLRERFVAQLMLALYRSGRQADALATYREARQLLIDEVGIEPSSSLQGLHRRLLDQDASLLLPGDTSSTRVETAVGDGERAFPSGTVTLLFTDVEGATRALQEVGAERYGVVLGEHRRFLRDAFATHNGVEVDTQGDAFLVAFARASDAVHAAASAQRALAALEWEHGWTIAVRMGIHTGEPQIADGRYVGLDVHRAARLMSAAHGGQVVVSQASKDLAEGELDGVHLLDLGAHRLKDLVAAERIYQLAGDGLEKAFPPLKTLHPMNVPVQPTPILGREREVAELKGLLCSKEVRLLTLTGPGGTGKTRLALELAGELVEHFPSGVFFVGLAPITEPELVFPAIAQTVGLREQPGQSVAETLRDYVRDRDLLLVLDNVERLLPVVPEIAWLLAESRRLKLLVTSRTVLRLAAEHVFSVSPLHEGAALSLFAARARAARPNFVVDGSREAVQEICRRLDGLPLAIELAAARVRALPPEKILTRLDRRLKLLTGGARDLPERQQTLRAAISWSHDLLSAEEQALFRRLAVFAGGCSLEAAEAVGDPDGQLSLDVLDCLGSLIDQSLFHAGRHLAGEPRFSMLETIREYALERLEESGEAAAVRRRHLEWAVALTEQSESEVRGSRASVVLERLEAEHDNFLAALTLPLDQEGAELRLRLLSALSEFWRDRGHVTEARRLLDEELKSSDIPPEIKAKAFYAAGVLANAQSHYGEAKVLLHDSIDLFLEHGDQAGRALSLCELSFSLTMAGDRSRARSFAEDALEIARGIGEAWLICEALSFASLALIDEEHNFDRMEQLLAECVELSRAAGYKQRLAHALNDLGCVALMRKDPERASELLTESLDIEDELGAIYYRTFALGSLGWARIGQKDAGEAGALFAEQLALSQRLGAKRNAGEALQGLAALAAGERRFARAACLFAAGRSLQASTGSAPWWPERDAWEQHESEIRAHLSPNEFNAAWVAGQEMTFDEAAAYGLSGESEPALSS